MVRDCKYDVVLAYPAERINIFENMIPLGLASMAALLEQDGLTVKMVDFNFYQGHFGKDLHRWDPKIVGIGGTTSTRKHSFHIAQKVKKVLPNVPVVYGGPHASFTASDTLRHVPDINYVIKGEGEYPFYALCKKFVRNESVDLAAQSGLSYRKEDTIIENRTVRIDDLNILPIPARHLFSGDYSMSLDLFDQDAECILTSRGCPGGCSFCSASRMFPGGVRYRSSDHVQKEIDTIFKQKNIKALKIFDSTFTSDHSHVRNFCRMIKPYNLIWECEIRADSVTRDLLFMMKDSGCVYIDIGLETANQEQLNHIGKSISVQQVETVLGWCRELGLKTKVFFIFGHLGQTIQQCKTDVEYIRDHKNEIDLYATTIGMRVYPGTLLEKRAKERGILKKGFSWALYRASLRNLLLFEAGDVLILEQEQLSFFHLLLIAGKLVVQRTVLSSGWIKKMIIYNLIRRGRWIGRRFR